MSGSQPFSFSLSSGSSKTPKTNGHAPATNGIKRPHASLHDSSDEEDGDEVEHRSSKGIRVQDVSSRDGQDSRAAKRQEVTHFGASGAFDERKAEEKEKKPLVIQAQQNKDWKEAAAASKRKKYGLPEQDSGAAKTGEDREAAIKKIEDAKKPQFGLVVRKSEVQTNDDSVIIQEEAEEELPDEDETQEEPREKTIEERAKDALLGKTDPTSKMTIAGVSEEEAFLRDYSQAPPEPSEADYAAVPVEEFGAALLRGMGWKDGEGIGSQSGKKIAKTDEIKRRPALLGIGAKSDGKEASEIGAWGREAKRRHKEERQVYNPVMLRNKATGETVTEDELQKRLEQQKDKDLQKQYVRDDDGEEKRHKDRRRRDDYDSEEDRSKRHRKSRHRDDYEEDRHRSKSDRRSRDDDSYDRHRSSRKDSDRSYERSSHKERDRDYDKRDKYDRKSRDEHRSRGHRDREDDRRHRRD